jgi:hypothetical protein
MEQYVHAQNPKISNFNRQNRGINMETAASLASRISSLDGEVFEPAKMANDSKVFYMQRTNSTE